MPTLIDNIKNLFARENPSPNTSPTTFPKSSNMFSPEAVIQAWGNILMLPDPDEILKKSGLSRGALRKMIYDDEVFGAIEKRRGRLNKTAWRLEIKEGEKDNDEKLAFLTEQLDKCFEEIITATWDALLFGYSVFELIYSRPEERNDNLIGLKDVSVIPFEWFRYDPNTFELLFFDAQKGGLGTPVDSVFKFFLTRNSPTYLNPNGDALLSRLYWPWFFRAQGWRFYMQWLERFATPTTLVHAQSNDTDERQKLANALAQAVQDSVIVVGKEDDVSFLEANGDGSAFEKMENLLTRRIQKLFHGANLSTEVNQSGGSRAATVVHREESYDKRDDDIRMVSPTIQKVINALCYINFPGMTPPKFVMEDESGLGLDRSERDSRLMTTGMIKLTKEYFLKTYDFEKSDIEIIDRQEVANANGKENKIKEDAKQIEAEKSKGGDVNDKRKGASRTTGSKKASDDKGIESSGLIASIEKLQSDMHTLRQASAITTIQTEINELSDVLMSQIPEPIDKDLIMEAIRKSKNEKELQSKLEKLADGVNLTFHQNLLARAFYTASVIGFVDKE